MPKIAIHAHVFYPDLWPELVTCIQNYIDVCGKENVLLLATRPKSNPNADNLIKGIFPSAKVIPVPNLGYDIGPLIRVLHEIDLDTYDYVVKIHTKRDVQNGWVNFRHYQGSTWRKALLSFCSTKDAVVRTLRAFASRPNLGMVADWRMIDPSGIGSCHHSRFTDQSVRALGLTPHGKTIVWGTMFMVRANLLKPFLKWAINDFNAPDANNPHNIAGLSSLAEGAFGMVVNAQGYSVCDARHNHLISALFYPFLKVLYTTLRWTSDILRR